MNDDDSDRTEIERDISHLSSIEYQFSQLLFDCISYLSNQTRQYIIDNDLYKSNSDGDYLKDKEQAVLKYIRTYISEQIEQYIRRLTKLIGQADIEIDINLSAIIRKADSDCVLVEQDNLYPPKKGVFSRREKVFLNHIETICSTIQSNINQLLNGYVNACISETDKVIWEKKQNIFYIDRSIASQKDKIRRYQWEIDLFNQQIKDLQQQQNDIKWKRKQDQNTLAMYLKYAEQSYNEQRNEIICQINRSKSADDKILLILLLGVLDKDYQKVTGGIHEDSHQYAIAK